jgi:FMN phosphatase YigB (HAD superfamily)
MPSPVQAVSFDLWQTLMHDNKEQAGKRAALRVARMHQALVHAGHAIALKEVEAACHEIWQKWQAEYWDKHVDPGFDAQLQFLRQRFGISPAGLDLLDELRNGYVEPIFALPPLADVEAIPLLTQLAARDLKLGLICNTSVTPGFALRRLLAGWGLDRLLPVQLFSDEIGVRKPSAEIFCEAARQLGVEIGALLHVGDRADADVQGAIDAGAQGLQVGPDAPLGDLLSRITTKSNTRPSGQGAA